MRMRQDRQRGFTMVETLVALVVLAIGLLGIAALYLDSLRAGRTAIYRTQAVNLSADLADRIRSNRAAIASYVAAYADVAGAVPACDTTAGCTAAELAAIIADDGFHHLKAPIKRVTTPDVHIPFSPSLEAEVEPTVEKVIAAVMEVLTWKRSA